MHVPGYTLGRQLGSGDFGVVISAHEDNSGRPVAIKLLPIRDPQARSQAAREARLLAGLQHPHLVPVYGAVEMPDGIALIMEFAGGGSLAELLSARGVLQPGEVVTVCAPIAQGLAEAHRHGIVHGMIKPSNILFTMDGRPMLSDVGVARLSHERRPGAGGVGFDAPEVAAGRRPTPSADLYGMAAVAVTALTGHLPGPQLSLPGLPPATYGALASSLSNDPGRRPDADAFANAVFALADPEPVLLNGNERINTGQFDAASIEAWPLDDDQPQDDVPSEGGRRARRSTRRSTRRDPDDMLNPAHRPAEFDTDEPEIVEPDVDDDEGEDGSGRKIRKRDILAGIAIVLTVPVIVFGVYVLWNQIFGDGDLPLAGRADTGGEQLDEDSELCGGQYPAPDQQPPAPDDWTAVVENLYTLRAQAYTELNSELLCDIYAPSHPRLAEDYEALQAYAEEDVHVEGLNFEVVTATLVSQESGLVTIEITDRISPYQLVDDEAGDVVVDQPASGEETWQIQLVPSAEGASWRIG